MPLYSIILLRLALLVSIGRRFVGALSFCLVALYITLAQPGPFVILCTVNNFCMNIQQKNLFKPSPHYIKNFWNNGILKSQEFMFLVQNIFEYFWQWPGPFVYTHSPSIVLYSVYLAPVSKHYTERTIPQTKIKSLQTG